MLTATPLLQRRRIAEDLIKNLQENNLAIFAGAGLSAPAGFVGWGELLRPIAEDLELDIEKENDLVALAQYHCNSNGDNRGRLNQILIDELSRNAESTENHKILARLPISAYWTTNYDKLIENSLSEIGKVPDTKYKKQQLSFTKPGRDAIVYKMHGDIDHPGEAILTKDDYESYHIKMQPFINALSGDLVSKTFLFLGFSFTDPNLDFILSRVRVAYTRDQRQHYCIQKLITPIKGESEADVEYRKRKQELFVQDLLRFGIKTILVENYSEITDFLKQIEWSYRRRTIFLSGAAHVYGTWNKSEAERFIYSLAKDIAAKDLRIVSGFGLGVGSSVITGVLEHVYMSGKRLDSDQLILRPFPQNQIGFRSRDELWAEYRSDMISFSGIAIFLFGNKLEDGNTINSDGLIKEFEIAKANNLLLLPIGATGYASREVYNRLIDEGYFDGDSFPKTARKYIDILGDDNSSLDALREAVLDILNSIV